MERLLKALKLLNEFDNIMVVNGSSIMLVDNIIYWEHLKEVEFDYTNKNYKFDCSQINRIELTGFAFIIIVNGDIVANY